MNDINQKNTQTAAFDSMVRKLTRNWHVYKNSLKNWNIKESSIVSDTMLPLQKDLETTWISLNEALQDDFSQIKSILNSEEYIGSLESELKTQGIPLSGEFPQYELPPFKLSVSLENFEARLSLGRKSERTSLLNPQELSKWVGIRYKRVSGRKFNSAQFMKDLLAAYKVANRLMYREKDEAWGRAVLLSQIYDIMTIKQTSRTDYPKQFFIYDLGLLKEQSTISLDEYRFEFGFARNQARAIVIVDSLGRESRLSSLTIYKEV